MNGDLDNLLRQAAAADGMDRINFRDRIAAHGPAAVARLEPWLSDARLGSFAVLTIRAAASRGALSEAVTVLKRNQTRVTPTVAGDIDRALAVLRPPRRASTAKATVDLSGSPAEALRTLRRLVDDWRRSGSPPQRAIKWRRADWIAAFPQHRDGLQALPAALDRADVHAATAGAELDPVKAEFSLLVVKAWGEGDNGYGPTRALESLEVTLEPGQRLMTALQVLHDRGALAAYERMSDGGDCRIFNLGPAFGTKFLYFCQPEGQRPQALIHDRNVADWLAANAGVSLASGDWSKARYAAYLAQMHAWAGELECSPEDLELCMFRSVLRPGNQWNDSRPEA